jgi:hypothetical protein
MNKESVKVNITCAGGRVEEVESDAIYGCAVTEDEKGGVACRSFFTGCFNPIKMGPPMGTSVVLVTKEMCAGNTELEYHVLQIAASMITTRMAELAGGNSHGGN